MSEQTPVKSPWMAFFGLLFAYYSFVQGLAFQIPATPVIRDVFGIPVASAAFIGLVYYLMHIVFGPFWGNLGDQYGRKKMTLIGLAIFVVSEFAAAAVGSFPLFLAIRMIQGVGTAAIVSAGLAYATYLFPQEKRGSALGTFAAIGTVGAAVGAMIGGIIVAKMGWQYIYIINGGFGLLAMALIAFTTPETPLVPKKQFDYLGAVLVLITVGALLSSTIFLSNKSPYTLYIVALGVILAIVLGVVEKNKDNAFLQLSFLKNPLFILPLIFYFLIQLSNTGAMTANSFFVNAKPNGGPLVVGRIMMYTYFAGALAGFVSGKLIDKVRIKTVLLGAIAFFFVGAVTFSMIKVSSPDWYIALALCIFTFSICMMMPACMKMALATVPKDKLGAGSGTYTMFQYMGNPAGGAVGLAIFGPLSATALAGQLTNLAGQAGLSSDMVPAVLAAGQTAGKTVDPSLTDALAKLGMEFADLFTQANPAAMVSALNSMSYIIMAVTAVVFLLTLFFLPNQPLDNGK